MDVFVLINVELWVFFQLQLLIFIWISYIKQELRIYFIIVIQVNSAIKCTQMAKMEQIFQ